jgi:hypothetical protein
MSENEASISPLTSSAGSAVVANDPVVSTTAGALPSGQWSQWALGAVDLQSVEPGVDLVSGDSGAGEWFPSVPVAELRGETLTMDANSDPLVSLPPAEFALHETNLDDGYAFASSEGVESGGDAGHDHSVHGLMAPADYGVPLDHIEWHFTGLLPLV